MQIIIKNYHHLSSKKYQNLNINIEKSLRNKKLNNIENINTYSLISLLNNNSILNPPFQHKLVIDFENFTLLNKIILNQKDYFKRKLNKWFKADFTTTDDYIFYNTEDHKIHVREHLFNQTNEYGRTFSQNLKNKIAQSDFLNFAILHEVGHSINHQYYLTNKKQLSSETQLAEFINESVSFNGYADLVENTPNKSTTYFRDKDLNLMNFHAVSEGFADLYACLAIGQTYPQEAAINLINSVIESRKEADKGSEFYQTHSSLESYLSDFKNNKLNINSFDEIYQYMSSLIEKTVINNIEKQFLKTSYPEVELNNRYLGLINKQLKINEKDCNLVINALNQQYNLNLAKIQYNEKEFKIGEILYEKNKHFLHTNNESKVKFNIKNIRDKLFGADKKNTLFNRYKNDI